MIQRPSLEQLVRHVVWLIAGLVVLIACGDGDPEPDATAAPSRPPLVVGLEVTEATGGLVESAFRDALASLSDVAVAPGDEIPRVHFRVAVLCAPDTERCGTARATLSRSS